MDGPLEGKQIFTITSVQTLTLDTVLGIDIGPTAITTIISAAFSVCNIITVSITYPSHIFTGFKKNVSMCRIFSTLLSLIMPQFRPCWTPDKRGFATGILVLAWWQEPQKKKSGPLFTIIFNHKW